MSSKPISIIAAIISVSSVLLDSPIATAQAAGNLIDLGAVAPGLGINNSGEVVLQNYIYSHGTLTAFPNGFTGTAINASGQVVGNGPGIYLNGTVTYLDLPANPLGGCYVQTGINDSGDVVGWFDPYCTTDYPSQPPGGWEYDNGAVTFFGGACYGGGTVPQAINDSGQITGSSSFCPNGPQDSFLYQNDKIASLGIGGAGYAINASGQVTGGQAYGSTSYGGFLYINGHVTMLPGRAGIGYSINASGFIVGDDVNGQPHAYLYNGVTIVDLNTLIPATDSLQPYVTLTDARGINDSGLVVVNGVDSRDKLNHAYLMQMVGLVGNAPPPSKSGGGAFDLLSLSFLIGMLALRRVRRKNSLPSITPFSKCLQLARVERAAHIEVARQRENPLTVQRHKVRGHRLRTRHDFGGVHNVMFCDDHG